MFSLATAGVFISSMPLQQPLLGAIVNLNIVIFALSARVNYFQDYFCQVFIFVCPSTGLNLGYTDVADILPLALSAVTFGIAILACIPKFSASVLHF